MIIAQRTSRPGSLPCYARKSTVRVSRPVFMTVFQRRARNAPTPEAAATPAGALSVQASAPLLTAVPPLEASGASWWSWLAAFALAAVTFVIFYMALLHNKENDDLLTTISSYNLYSVFGQLFTFTYSAYVLVTGPHTLSTMFTGLGILAGAASILWTWIKLNKLPHMPREQLNKKTIAKTLDVGFWYNMNGILVVALGALVMGILSPNAPPAAGTRLEWYIRKPFYAAAVVMMGHLMSLGWYLWLIDTLWVSNVQHAKQP